MARRHKRALGPALTVPAQVAAAAKIEEAVGATLRHLGDVFELQDELRRDYPDADLPHLRLWSKDGWLYVIREARLSGGSRTQETVVAKYRVPVYWGEIGGRGHTGPDGEWVDDSDPVVWEVEP